MLLKNDTSGMIDATSTRSLHFFAFSANGVQNNGGVFAANGSTLDGTINNHGTFALESSGAATNLRAIAFEDTRMVPTPSGTPLTLSNL